jgi:uncharacterized protein YqgC (DUF456 family)
LLTIVFGLPGTWVILAASFIYGWATDYAAISIRLLVGLLIMAVAAEVMDYAAGIWGARRYGGSKKAMIGTLVGGVLGAIVMAPVMFGLGSIFGAFLGAFAGACSMTFLEQRKMDEAVRVGWGALMGRIFATVFKAAVALTMIGLDYWAIFTSPPT